MQMLLNISILILIYTLNVGLHNFTSPLGRNCGIGITIIINLCYTANHIADARQRGILCFFQYHSVQPGVMSLCPRKAFDLSHPGSRGNRSWVLSQIVPFPQINYGIVESAVVSFWCIVGVELTLFCFTHSARHACLWEGKGHHICSKYLFTSSYITDN